MGGTISQPWMLYEVCTFLPRDERTPFFQLCKYLASMTVKPAHHRWLCRQLARESLIYGKTKGECVCMRWSLMYESFISLSLELAFLPPLAPSHVGEQVTRFFNPQRW